MATRRWPCARTLWPLRLGWLLSRVPGSPPAIRRRQLADPRNGHSKSGDRNLTTLGGGGLATLPRRAKKLSKEAQEEIAERFIKEKSVWVQRTLKRFDKTSKTQSRKFTASEIAEYKKKAQTLAAARLAYFNQFYGFTWARISIRDQKTRWGSCSRKGNLNFNYKIALLEPALADYIVVHELCHLRQMNHSPAFWKLVEKTIPDYAARRTALKKGSISPG